MGINYTKTGCTSPPSLPLYVHTHTHTTTVRLSVFQIRSAPKQRSRFEFLFCEEEEEEEDEIEELCSWFSFSLPLSLHAGGEEEEEEECPPPHSLSAGCLLCCHCRYVVTSRGIHTRTHTQSGVCVGLCPRGFQLNLRPDCGPSRAVNTKRTFLSQLCSAVLCCKQQKSSHSYLPSSGNRLCAHASGSRCSQCSAVQQKKSSGRGSEL